MKRNFLMFSTIAVIGTSLLMACGAAATEEGANEETASVEAKTMNVNLDASSVMWKGTMLGVYSHEGTVKLTEGNVSVADGKITAGSFTVDLSNINPTDQNYDPAQDRSPEKLVGHLQSPDFFDVATYPTASFVITGNKDGDLIGNLTVRGITNEETVNNVSFNEANNTWTGTMTFDRKKYDVAWDSQMKDMVLSDDIELSVNLSL